MTNPEEYQDPTLHEDSEALTDAMSELLASEREGGHKKWLTQAEVYRRLLEKIGENGIKQRLGVEEYTMGQGDSRIYYRNGKGGTASYTPKGFADHFNIDID